jgi:hypothetical protein
VHDNVNPTEALHHSTGYGGTAFCGCDIGCNEEMCVGKGPRSTTGGGDDGRTVLAEASNYGPADAFCAARNKSARTTEFEDLWQLSRAHRLSQWRLVCCEAKYELENNGAIRELP